MLQRTSFPPSISVRAPLRVRVPADAFEAPAVRLLRGREAILAVRPLLAELAARSGQSGEADSLLYFLSTPDAVKKMPCLLLVGGRGADAIEGAVLIFEYKTRLGGTRVYATADLTGRRTVIAEPECRARVAAVASRTLIAGGAQVVHISFSETHAGPEGRVGHEVPAIGHARHEVSHELVRGRGAVATWMLEEQDLPLYLPLHGSFDETLAHIGQRTRSNLRYYRRRCELDLGSRFVAEVRISLREFLAFNRECTYAVADELAEWRYGTLHGLPNTLLRGVCDRNGRWLSLVGMRRYGRSVEIDWQMNRAELPASSLSTVMRAYLIEHEVGRGTTRLYIEGGTPQPIGRSFLKERVAELTVKRRSLFVWLLQRFGGRLFPVKNRLGQILADPRAEWVACDGESPRKRMSNA